MLDLNIPCVEPKKRWIGGEFRYATHRFPIKDGITPREMMRRMLMESQYETNQTMLANIRAFIFAGEKKDGSP